LSPYLFVLCMEFFSRTSKQGVAIGPFLYHPRSKKLGITHLVFTDD